MSSSSKSILLYPILINLRQPANSQLYLLFRQVCLSVAQLASQLASQISKQLDGTSKLLLIRVATYLPSQLPYPVGWFILLCESDVKAIAWVGWLSHRMAIFSSVNWKIQISWGGKNQFCRKAELFGSPFFYQKQLSSYLLWVVPYIICSQFIDDLPQQQIL